MIIKKSILLGLVCYFFLPVTYAISVDNLYTANIPNSLEKKITNPLLQDALKQVLVKVSGNSQVIANKNLNELKNLNDFIQSYGYVSANKSLLRVQFYPKEINALLETFQAPIWGRERPLLIIWASLKQPNQSSEIIGSEANLAVKENLKDRMDERGIPVLFPMMDLTDMNQISVDDISQLSIPKLKAVSKRYQSDGLLIINIQQTASLAMLQAKVILPDLEFNWNLQGSDLSNVVKLFVNQMADTLGAHYASIVSETEQTTLDLKIIGIKEQEDISQVAHYLKRLSVVSAVELDQITGQTIVLTVHLKSSGQAFTKALAAENKLEFISGSEGQMIYQWNP